MDDSYSGIVPAGKRKDSDGVEERKDEEKSKKVKRSVDDEDDDEEEEEFVDEDREKREEDEAYIILPSKKTRTGQNGTKQGAKLVSKSTPVGLINQGATCYLNSMLQILFHNIKLRQIVFGVDPSAREQAPTLYALKKVFSDLQSSLKPVSTVPLTNALGWTEEDCLVNNDIQEFIRVFIELIEAEIEAITNIQQQSTITEFFQGYIKTFTKCLKIKYESSKYDSFLDIQLQVIGMKDVIESFASIVQPERMAGENMYEAGSYGKQEADKTTSFVRLPPVLHLQLLRFQFDRATKSMEKIYSRFEFPEVLELDRFLESPNHDDPATYVLHALVVHEGAGRDNGHYFTYINPRAEPGGTWIKVDDHKTRESSYEEAVVGNYGSPDLDYSAYLLQYIRKSSIDQFSNMIPCSSHQ